MKRIEIIVMPDGSTKLQTTGFSGGACREASRFLEQSLGLPGSEQLTAEYHQSDQTQQTLDQGR